MYTESVYLSTPGTQVVDAVLTPELAGSAGSQQGHASTGPVSASAPSATKAGLSGLLAFPAIGIGMLSLLRKKDR